MRTVRGERTDGVEVARHLDRPPAVRTRNMSPRETEPIRTESSINRRIEIFTAISVPVKYRPVLFWPR